MSSGSASLRPPFYTVCRCFLNIAQHKCSANMFLLELHFFVFHLPKIKLKKKDRVFGSDRKWRFCVSCFATSSRNLRRPLGWHFLRHIISCDLISCKVDKSTPFLCLWHFEARSRLSVLHRSVYFWGFYPFQIFIVPIHRAITKNICKSTCDKSRVCIIHG